LELNGEHAGWDGPGQQVGYFFKEKRMNNSVLTDSPRTIIAPSDPIVFQNPGLDNLEPEHAKTWMEQNDRRLKEHVITVPKAWRKAVIDDYRFPRDCFARAIQFIHQSPHMPDVLYVFGEAVGGGIGQHGWVEIEDRVVFDGVMQQFYERAGYYSAEKARP
jgi:hypothetical protein